MKGVRIIIKFIQVSNGQVLLNIIDLYGAHMKVLHEGESLEVVAETKEPTMCVYSCESL